MSLLSKLAKGIKKVAKKVVKSPLLSAIPGPVGTLAKLGAVAGVGAGAVKVSASKALAVIPGKGLSATTKALGAGVAGSVAGGALYDAAGNYLGERPRRRRMNPMNHRAAKRAIRRVKAVRKILMNIEKQLPKAKARSCPPSARRH